MSQLEAIVSVSIAGLALSATPGPSMLYVLSRSVGQSRAAGLASALGLCLGGVLLAVATAMGLTTVFAQFDWLVVVLRYVGSAYLVWLGLGMIRSAREKSRVRYELREVRQKSLPSIIWQGILVELLNPKTVLFFVLFLPPFVTASGGQIVEGNVQRQLLILGVMVPLTAIPCDLVVAYLGGTITKSINRGSALREGLAWVGGLILIGIALNLHLGAL